MAQTVANFADVMKEVWTSDRLEKQFYDKNPFLDRIEKTNRFTIGSKAVVPLHAGRSGGFTTTPAAGSAALNPADEQKVDRAEYTIPYHWFQVKLEAAALNQAGGGAQSVASALDLEVTGAIDDGRHQIERQLLGNGDALIAVCETTSNSTTVELAAAGYGYDAIKAGWLYPGMTIDIGTTGNEVLRADAHTITAVSESSSDPDIVVSAAVTTDSSDYVSVTNARSGTTSYETNGLRQIFGSTSSAVGGLDPDTAGEEFWKPAQVKTDTALTLDMLLDMQRATFQKGGTAGYYILTSLKQQANFYAQLQSQVRFSGDRGLGAGNVESAKWNGLEIHALPSVPDRELYLLHLEDLFLVTGKWSKPTWVSDIEGGSGGRLRWGQNTTSFVDAFVYPLNLAVRNRNRSASNVSLTA